MLKVVHTESTYVFWKFLESQKQTHITLLFKTHITQNKTNPNPSQWPLTTYGIWSPVIRSHLLLQRGKTPTWVLQSTQSL